MSFLLSLIASLVTPAHASDEDCYYALEYGLAAQSSLDYAQSVCGRIPHGLYAIDGQMDMAVHQLNLATTFPGMSEGAVDVLGQMLDYLDIIDNHPLASDACLDAIADVTAMTALALEYANLCDEDVTVGTCTYDRPSNICTVYVERGSVSCTGYDAPAAVTSTDSGMTLSLDMTAYEAVQVDADLYEVSEWVMHLGNSPTNDGYCGDSSTTENDSEAWIYGTDIAVCASDRGLNDYALSDADVIDASGDQITMQACDGEFHYQTDDAANSVYSDYIFQIDGDEPDTSTLNDQWLYLGIERVIANTTRLGYGVDGDTVTISFFAR